MPMIVLDYDKTFTANPDMWLQLTDIMKSNGYRVVGATARNRYEPVKDSRYFQACEFVVYCAGNSKKKVLQNLHLTEDIIWIDDDPRYIVHSYDDLHDQPYTLDTGIPDDFYSPSVAYDMTPKETQ